MPFTLVFSRVQFVLSPFPPTPLSTVTLRMARVLRVTLESEDPTLTLLSQSSAIALKR